MFEFLAPVFAAVGVAAAAVPFVLHMLRRTPSQKMTFSLVRFLPPSLPKLTKRSTIEHWPLMLLRILAVLLIAAAFARPFWRVAVAALQGQSSGDRVAVLLDASASMRRDGLRDKVLAELRRVTAELGDRDSLSITAFSHETRPLLSASEWQRTEPGARSTILDAVQEKYEPDWMDTNTGLALLNAADNLAQEQAGQPRVGRRRIIVITDFQRGSRLEELQSTAWPAGIDVDLRVVSPESRGNTGISLLDEDRDGQPRVRIVNSGDSDTTSFQLQPFDSNGSPVGTPLTANVAPGQQRSLTVPAADRAGQRVVAGIELVNDPHPFDNVVDLPLTDAPVLRVAHVGPSDANDAATMRYYLQRAIDGNETEPIELVDTRQRDDLVLPVADDVRLIVATDAIPESLVPSIQSCLDRGGVLLLALKSVAMLDSAAALLPEPISAQEAAVDDYVMFGRIDFSSPLFSTFADARFSDFSSIRFWHYRALTLQPDSAACHLVARFDSGLPAILEMRTESGGRILLFASGWQPDDSQWALSTRFAPMMTNLIRQSSPTTAGQIFRFVGDTIEPAALTGTSTWTLTLPDRTTLTPQDLAATVPAVDGNQSLPEEAGGVEGRPAETIFTFRQPGRYTLTGSDTGAPRVLALLVGVPPAESRTDPLPLGQLQALGIQAQASDDPSADSGTPDPATDSQLSSSQLESRQKLWRWLLLAGLGCLMLETVLAGVIERRQRVETVT